MNQIVFPGYIYIFPSLRNATHGHPSNNILGIFKSLLHRTYHLIDYYGVRRLDWAPPVVDECAVRRLGSSYGLVFNFRLDIFLNCTKKYYQNFFYYF